jgi:enoyl-CoA hydratase/carnithine racemase
MIEVIEHEEGRIRELRLARPPVNALDPTLIAGLRSALQAAAGDGREAIVLSGAPGRFSGGLDVPVLLQLDRAGIAAAWDAFFGLLRDIARSEVPIVAALTGHSPAGGMVLALYADQRVMADGPYLIGLNEVEVGLPVPPPILRALSYAVGPRQAELLAAGGLLMGPAEALRRGLVDEVVPAAEVVPRAVAWTRERLARPRGAMLATRRMARRPLVAAFEGFDGAAVAAVVDQWFSAETQATLRALAARLGKPR